MAEYYIRQPGAEEARGPFDEDKMTSLAEAGQISLETEYYDDASSTWLPVGGNAELKALLFPERKKLGLKKERDDIKFLNKPEDVAAPAVTVSQMLAAAEGESKETKYLKEQQKSEARAAAMALPVLMFGLYIFWLLVLLGGQLKMCIRDSAGPARPPF